MKIVFPEKRNQRYWNIHYNYVLQIFQNLNYDISYNFVGDAFIVNINGKDYLFDYADSYEKLITCLPTFKFHARTNDTFIFPSVSFDSWNLYESLNTHIKYNPNRECIGNRQRPYGNAKDRRNAVRKLLIDKFGKKVKTEPELAQMDFIAEKIKLHVHVPGWCNNMADRATLQMFAVGTPVITTNIPDLRIDGKTWDGCYIQCKDDYSDLLDIIDNVKDKELLKVSEASKEAFRLNCTPKAIDQYLKTVIS
jgi:hypothetical protein